MQLLWQQKYEMNVCVIEPISQCSTTGVTMSAVCAILSLIWYLYKLCKHLFIYLFNDEDRTQD